MAMWRRLRVCKAPALHWQRQRHFTETLYRQCTDRYTEYKRVYRVYRKVYKRVYRKSIQERVYRVYRKIVYRKEKQSIQSIQERKERIVFTTLSLTHSEETEFPRFQPSTC